MSGLSTLTAPSPLRAPSSPFDRYHPVVPPLRVADSREDGDGFTTRQPTGRLESRFAHGDPAALRHAYDEHGATIYSYCRRRLDDDRARDVTQEVFVSAWRGQARFDPRQGSLGAWLMSIAKNRLIDELRREGRHDRHRSDAPADHVPDDSEVERVADRMLLADGLRHLDTARRRLIEMNYLQGLTHAEIAENTGRPLGTVKSEIRRGLEQLRRHLGTTT